MRETASENESPRASRRFFFTKAVHWAFLLGSSWNSGVRAVGGPEGRSVARRSKVFLIARERSGPSKGNVAASSTMSKKSFMRLFAMPRSTMAWNFSATTVSRG